MYGTFYAVKRIVKSELGWFRNDYARKKRKEKVFSKMFTKCSSLKGIAKEKPTQKVMFLIVNNSCFL